MTDSRVLPDAFGVAVAGDAADAPEWFYDDGGEQAGPVPLARLKALVAVGELAPSVLVWRNGMPDWAPYAQMQQAPDRLDALWFYEERGKRAGPVSEAAMVELIEDGDVEHGTLVWRSGFSDWVPAAGTGLAAHLSGPPPLTGDGVGNAWAWWLAFAPVIGLTIQYFIAGALVSDYSGTLYFNAQLQRHAVQLWWVSFLLNTFLLLMDWNALRRAGQKRMSLWWIVLIPGYLYMRAQRLKQSQAPFIMWCVAFIASLVLF